MTWKELTRAFLRKKAFNFVPREIMFVLHFSRNNNCLHALHGGAEPLLKPLLGSLTQENMVLLLGQPINLQFISFL
jgi:hypothetical protein